MRPSREENGVWPILMTSFAFIAGLIPLVRATGAGAIGNRTIGTAAAGGMLVGTVIAVLVIPGLYHLFARIAEKRNLIKDEADTSSEVLNTERRKHAMAMAIVCGILLQTLVLPSCIPYPATRV